MRLLAVDQAMHTTGWAVADEDRLTSFGELVSLPKLKDIAAMLDMREQIRAQIESVEPELVIFEDIHMRRGVSTAFKLAGLLYILRAMCEDDQVPYTLVSSNEFQKHLHLAIMKTNRDKKADRAKAYVQSLLWGSPTRAPHPNKPTDDECSAIVLLEVVLKRDFQVEALQPSLDLGRLLA